MWKKVILAAALAAVSPVVNAQIGYKGQVTLSAAAGINQTANLVASAHVGCYVSPHSIIGAGVLYDKTRYDVGKNDSFQVAQWLGNIRYQYAVPVGKFMLLPTGGLLLGVENSDPISRQGNRVMYSSKFVYGLAFDFDAEYIFSRHWSLTLEPRLTYLINTSFDSVKVSASLGVKYYF